jgi:hypothetical protein
MVYVEACVYLDGRFVVRIVGEVAADEYFSR